MTPNEALALIGEHLSVLQSSLPFISPNNYNKYVSTALERIIAIAAEGYNPKEPVFVDPLSVSGKYLANIVCKELQDPSSEISKTFTKAFNVTRKHP